MKTFEQFVNEEYLTPREVIQHITDITPDDSDVPDYFFELIRKSKKNFVKKQLNIDDILLKDVNAREYVDSGEERYGEYGESSYEPDPDEIDYPIVILNNEAMDGYSRLSALKRMGEKTVIAYIA